jgi:guanylate kinase
MRKGLLIILSGPSGVGKHTLWLPLLEDKHVNLGYSISMTTRPKRFDEENGREYFFVPHADFEKAIQNNQMLEYAQYCGNYYGTPKQYVDNLRNKGINVLLEIDAQGGLQLIKNAKKNDDKSFVSVFVLPPSLNELIKRLSTRGTETKEKIASRVKVAK